MKHADCDNDPNTIDEEWWTPLMDVIRECCRNGRWEECMQELKDVEGLKP